MGNIWTHIICLLFGLLGGYFIKDNFSKPDNEINISLKKNKLFNKTWFGRKKKILNNDNTN